jgi:hypothetical protein
MWEKVRLMIQILQAAQVEEEIQEALVRPVAFDRRYPLF